MQTSHCRGQCGLVLCRYVLSTRDHQMEAYGYGVIPEWLPLVHTSRKISDVED